MKKVLQKCVPAFSLIEMSIVLVVIGIIAGAVFKGQELLEAVITLGATGAIAVYGENIWFCPARDVKVVDTTGAGDGFAGGFLYRLSAGWTIPECLQLGSYMAGEVVSRIGARIGASIDENLKNIVKNQKYKQLLVKQFENQVIDS